MALQPLSPTPPQQPSAAAATSPPTAGAAALRSDEHSHIPGWGADLDHENRPAYPKERTPPRLEGLHWQRPSEQARRIRIYHSPERPSMTPVFGTSTPPSGLSGWLRALAYRSTENDVRHWLLLLVADRINVAEGLLQDLAHGHIPNILQEMGIRTEWKYNRPALIGKVVIGTLLAAGAVRFLGSRPGNRRPDRSRIAMPATGVPTAARPVRGPEKASLSRPDLSGRQAFVVVAALAAALSLVASRRRS